MALRTKAWNRVAFVNDTRPHTIVSDRVDVHTQCPPINGNKTDASLLGRIVVQ